MIRDIQIDGPLRKHFWRFRGTHRDSLPRQVFIHENVIDGRRKQIRLLRYLLGYRAQPCRNCIQTCTLLHLQHNCNLKYVNCSDYKITYRSLNCRLKRAKARKKKHILSCDIRPFSCTTPPAQEPPSHTVRCHALNSRRQTMKHASHIQTQSHTLQDPDDIECNPYADSETSNHTPQ